MTPEAIPSLTSPSSSRPLLVVEDSDEDFTTLSRVLHKLGVTNPIHRCVDGAECLEFLRKSSSPDTAYRADTLPALVLLDLNLPGMDGRKTLKAIKADPRWRTMPVTVLTTSSNPLDIQECYGNGANAYVTKPLDYRDFMETVRTVTNFWLQTVLLP